MKHMTWPRLVLACLAAGPLLAPAIATGQEPRRLAEPDSVPLALASALVASGGFPSEPQILVGSMPEWITNRLYVPAGARVLGSAFLGTTIVGVITVTDAPETAIAEFKRQLLQKGWKAPPPAPTYNGGGFRPAPVAPPSGPTTHMTLCGDQQVLTASAARRRGEATDVTLRVISTTTFSACRFPEIPTSMIRSPFPTLINPPGAPDARMNGDCSTTSMGSMGTGTTLRTSMTPDALLDHYGKQLQDSGWASPGDKAPIVSRTWTRTDSTGAPVETSITVTTSPRDSGCREINLQVRTLRRP
jgi:hypothetical protein